MSDPFSVGGSETGVSEMIEHDGKLYLSGWAIGGMPGADRFAYVIAVETDGTVIEAYVHDPSDLDDGFFDLLTEGSRLYAAGGRGWERDPGYRSATATVVAFDVPLEVDGWPVWETQPDELDAIFAIDKEPDDDGLFVAGLFDDRGVVLRCTTDGVCP